jgi:mannan endo-1,6-alpha-mannosidase
MTTCNGGLKWQYTTAAANGGFYYKNSVSNGGFFQIAARLARYTGNDTYTMWAEKVWDWSTGVGLVSPNGNVYDGAGDANGLNCTEVNHDEWTYNVGSYMHGAAHMYNITNGSSVWDARISGLVNTAIANAFNMSNATGIAYEAKCELTDTCDIDQLSFKGYLARWMAKTTILVPKLDSIIMPVLMTSATAAAQACVGPANNITCGAQWYVPGGDGTSSMPQQMAALEVVESLLIGNAPVLAKLAV